MPAQKLSYKVDVESGSAVREFDRLGKAGRDAGKDIADGFDDAETASKSAIKAMTATMDQLEADAKGAASAVAAISEHLTVDVDASTIDRFVSDLKSKFGLAFDDVTQDAKAFADVLERGVDMSKTTGEIRNVGDQLDTTRSEADQSRSVLANMAGNAAQDMGELGGVVGTLGVGIGQLAEYATEGNISMRGLAGVAGPMAALTAASFVIQGISSGLADLKKRQEAYTQQQEDFNTALRDTGSLQETVNDMLTENVQLAGAPELNWWQDMMDDLPVLTGLVDDTATSQSSLVQAMAHAGITADAFTFSLDHGLGSFNAMEQAFADARDQHLITAEEYELLTKQHDLYSQTALKAEVQQQALNTVFGDGTTAMAAYSKALPTPEAMAQIAADQEALAVAAREASEMIRAGAQNAHDAYTIMRQSDWGAAKADAATTVMQEYFATADAGLHQIGDLSDAYQQLGDAIEAQRDATDGESILPNIVTPEGRAVLDALDQLGSALIPQISKAYANSHGSINRFKSDMDAIYQSTLVGLSNQLGVSTEDVEALLKQIGFTPENFDTMYTLSGTEEAKLKLSLLQTQIDKLPEYEQVEIRQLIIEGDYIGALDRAQQAFARGVKVPLNADDSNLYKSLSNVQRHANSNPIVVPMVTRGVTGGYHKDVSGRAVEPAAAGVGVDTMAAPAAAATSAGFAAPVITLAAPSPNVSISVTAGVVGNRWDVARAVTRAVNEAHRLGRL